MHATHACMHTCTHAYILRVCIEICIYAFAHMLKPLENGPPFSDSIKPSVQIVGLKFGCRIGGLSMHRPAHCREHGDSKDHPKSTRAFQGPGYGPPTLQGSTKEMGKAY